VLSFAILTEYFPKKMSSRANAALNLLHVGAAFLLQTGVGLIIAQWPQLDGTYPAEAYQTAMAALIGLEFGASGLFVIRLDLMAPVRTPTKHDPRLRAARFVSTSTPLTLRFPSRSALSGRSAAQSTYPCLSLRATPYHSHPTRS
jgi:hypothetical protein